MATKTNSGKLTFGRKTKKRKGITSKSKNSWNPNSKNYKKPYRGQGR